MGAGVPAGVCRLELWRDAEIDGLVPAALRALLALLLEACDSARLITDVGLLVEELARLRP